MGCESCSDGSCGSNNGLPPGMLEKYRLNTDRSDGFLVWIETYVGPDGNVAVSEVCKEILCKIRSLDNGRSRIWGVVFGHTELKPLYPEIYAYGVETLYEVHDRKLSKYHPEVYAENIAQVIIRTEPAVVLFGATPKGREIAPRVAAMLDAGLTADCTDLILEDRVLSMVRPAFAGNLLATIQCTGFPQIATVRPGTFPLGEPKEDPRGTVIYWQNCGGTLKDIVSSELKARPTDDISKAKILISLGAGVKKESIPIAESIAKRIGATVSCSRKLVEKGYFPQSRQVGQSGRTVAPDIYLAFGISGAVQHLAGIGSAKRVVVVNKDPEAPIGSVADEFIVADADKVLRELDKIV
ncbi:MAG: electron transfer flavoprotein subunit alpha/FixB family protein [archaeon]|nr:electron transfer flavoprotein subunit alpha/FixB family protein [archaeon]